MKKINGRNDESKVPSFKPLEPRSPSLGTIVGKFFAASSSLDPHKPEPFGYTSVGQSTYDVPKSNHQEVIKDHYVAPAAADYIKPESSHSDSPFEETPNYVNQNFEDYATSDTKDAPQTVEVPSKLKQLKNPVKSQLVKEVSGATITNSLGLQSQNINYSPQASQLGEYSLTDTLSQKPESITLPQSQPLNPGQISNGYSFLDDQLGIAQNLSTFPSSYISQTPIEPISLGEYTQQYGSSPFLAQNSFSNQYTDVQNMQYQTPNLLMTPSGFGANLNVQSSLGGPTFEETSIVGNQAYSDIGAIQNYIDPIPSRVLQTPKKTFSLSSSVSKPPKSLDPYNDPRISHYKKRKPNVPKRKPSYGNVYKPKNPDYDFVQSISYEIGPNGAKRLN